MTSTNFRPILLRFPTWTLVYSCNFLLLNLALTLGISSCWYTDNVGAGGKKKHFLPTFRSFSGWANTQISIRQINRRKQPNLIHMYMGGSGGRGVVPQEQETEDTWGRKGLYAILS